MPVLSVIIPVLGEEERIGPAVAALRGLSGPWDLDIVIVDGSDGRTTLSALTASGQDRGVRGLSAPPGRAAQMNAGAAVARGEILLFLHADTALPESGLTRMAEVLGDADVAGGAFSLDLVPSTPWLRLVAAVGGLRSRLTRAPYGDQAIFLRAGVFRALGGYAGLPLFEDLELMTRLRHSGRRIVILPEAARSSARRWEQEGMLRCTLRNWLLLALYHAGVPAARLARHYPALPKEGGPARVL